MMCHTTNLQVVCLLASFAMAACADDDSSAEIGMTDGGDLGVTGNDADGMTDDAASTTGNASGSGDTAAQPTTSGQSTEGQSTESDGSETGRGDAGTSSDCGSGGTSSTG